MCQLVTVASVTTGIEIASPPNHMVNLDLVSGGDFRYDCFTVARLNHVIRDHLSLDWPARTVRGKGLASLGPNLQIIHGVYEALGLS